MTIPTAHCFECSARLTRNNRASSNGGGPDFEDTCTSCYDREGYAIEHEDGGHEPGAFPQLCPRCEEHLDKARHARQKKPVVAKVSISKGISRTVEGIEASKAKARAFLLSAQEYGWDVAEFEEDPKIGEFWIMLTNAETGEEIEASWVNGVWQYPCIYAYDGRELKILNAAAARHRMASGPDVAIRRRSGPEAAGDEPERRGRVLAYRVPFDVDTASEAEIYTAVYGRKLVWENALSGQIEEARVTGRKHLHIETARTSGRRILSFVDSRVTGFRAVALESLVQVV